MLDTVEFLIKNSPCISFRKYFIQYVFDVQDANIDSEVTFLLRNNRLNSVALNQLINSQLGGISK